MYVAACDLNFESDGAFAGSNNSGKSMNPASTTSQDIVLQTSRHPSLPDIRGSSIFLVSTIHRPAAHLFSSNECSVN